MRTFPPAFLILSIQYYIMVLESVVVPESWEEHPRRMLIIGFLYATVGMFLALWVFGKDASIAGIFLTTIPLVVIMYRAINYEEGKDMRICKEYLLMKEHMHILWFFLYMFIGMVLAYTFWFTVLPGDVIENLFSSQIEAVTAVSSKVATTGAAVSPTKVFELILVNNLQVLAFCIIFSFIYGAGAIFILVWNASVIGVAIGSMMKQGLQRLGELGHNATLMHYFTVLPVGLTYLVHGLPEMASYFLGSLAGGIISVAVVCHHYREPQFWHILMDSLDLLLLSLTVLLMSAAVEVWVTPALF